MIRILCALCKTDMRCDVQQFGDDVSVKIHPCDCDEGQALYDHKMCKDCEVGEETMEENIELKRKLKRLKEVLSD